MAGVGYVRPENVHRCFQVLPAPVEQVDVCGILDVGGGHRGVQDQLAAVFLSARFLLFGRVRVSFPFLPRCFGADFPACAGRLIPILWIIVPVHIPLLLRPLPRADIFVDFCCLLHWKPLAEMHHHRRIEQRLRLELVQAQKILHIAVFLELLYNTGKLRCPVCDGAGVINLDVQFLPDVTIPCPECRGSRYEKDAYRVRIGKHSLPDLMAMDVNEALEVCRDWRMVHQRLQVLQDLGLGYLTLGEETPSLSGGEAQRLKLASEMGRAQSDSLFVFDEPTIGLHPLDVRTLLGVFQTLIGHGATVVVIEHDLDVIRNADYLIDMGPGGGEAGGRVVAAGTPEAVAGNTNSITGRYLK